jgi:hypothetical protein
MNPLILKFAEKPEFKSLDYSMIEYSYTKNLSVLKNSDISAISIANMDTETLTKADTEPTDSDYDIQYKIKSLMETRSDTYTTGEQSDADDTHRSIKSLMDTHTITESQEPTDSDR